MNQTDQFGLMSIQEVQDQLGVGRTTVYNLLHAGKLESVKVGKYRRIKKVSFNSYIENIFESSH